MRHGAAAALLLLLAACSGPTDRATLGDALDVAPAGYTAQATEPPPGQLCSSSTETPPALDGDLGRSTAAAWRSGDAELRVWAWTAPTADVARQTVEGVAAHADACASTLFADYDTDGDGQLDAGSSEVQTGRRWSGGEWAGARVTREVDGRGAESSETRYVGRGDVVVLVMSSAEDHDAVLDGYLDRLADALG